MKKKIKKQVAIFNIFAIILYFMAVAWNLKTGSMYNLEIGIGALFLGLIKVWQEFLK